MSRLAHASNHHAALASEEEFTGAIKVVVKSLGEGGNGLFLDLQGPLGALSETARGVWRLRWRSVGVSHGNGRDRCWVYSRVALPVTTCQVAYQPGDARSGEAECHIRRFRWVRCKSSIDGVLASNSVVRIRCSITFPGCPVCLIHSSWR